MRTIHKSTRMRRFSLGALAGLAAGILATLTMLLLNFTLGGISLPEALASAIALALPLPLFNYLHDIFGGDAKHYLYYIIVVGQCLVFALLAGLTSLLVTDKLGQIKARWRNNDAQLHYNFGLLLALALWLFSGFVFLPLTGAGIFGSALNLSLANGVLSLALIALLFSLLFVHFYNWLTLRATTQGQGDLYNEVRAEQRRSFVKGALIALGLGGLGWAAIRFVTGAGGGSNLDAQTQNNLVQNYQSKISPPPTPQYGDLQPVANLSSEVTPNDQFYVVSKNFTSDPNIDATSWNLRVEGLVQKPYTLSYRELAALPMQKQYETLMCISNEVGGKYMGNAFWEGVPLANLLQRTGSIKPGATKVVLHAADGYADSIHLSKALEPTTLIALRMNGKTLPQGHGYPARLLVPGIYGMKHVKWITGIEVVNTDFKGYWQQSGWSDPAPVRMTSRIDTPLDNATLKANQSTYIAGVAFSGNKGISQVDVSLDGGKNWQTATLKRPLSALTWVLWEIPWQPTKTGSYTILVRAIDLRGNVQNPQSAPPLPDGSSGYHNVTVTVS